MDGLNPKSFVKIVLPRMPMLVKTTASHTLGTSETSKYWDLKTELTIKFLRSMIADPKPTAITKLQRLTMHDPGVKGKMWVAKVNMPSPSEDSVRNVLKQAIDGLSDTKTVVVSPYVPVEAEWTGYRFDAKPNTPRPEVPEAEQYDKLMSDTRSDTTIMYIHGGGHYLLDPAAYRATCAQLAKQTGGRCLSIRYRLAPQNPFPAALLDVLTCYLSLLHPPPGALHAAVPPEKIVFSGDSAGGNLSLALLQVLLQINRSAEAGNTFQFHGADISLPLPLPAGVAVVSPWTDLVAAMPSNETNLKYDYLPSFANDRMSGIKPDEAWPTDPPRVDLYCDGAQLLHPLVSPLAAHDWSGSCPVYFVVGEECLTDEGRGVAGRMASQGVPVEWWEYQAMPHVFPIMMQGTAVSRLCFEQWTSFIQRVTGVQYAFSQEKPSPAVTAEHTSITTKATRVELPSLQLGSLTVDEMCPFSPEDIAERMQQAWQRRMKNDPAYGTGAAKL